MMIPRVIHTIWWQAEEPPIKYQNNIRRIRALNTHWQVRRWKDEELLEECSKLGSIYCSCYQQYKLMHQKIDFGRFVILLLHGGISVDVDVTALKSFDDTPHLDKYPFMMCRSSVNCLALRCLSLGHLTHAYNNSLIVCTPNSPHVRGILDVMVQVAMYESSLTFYTIQWTTGPFMFTKTMDRISDDDVYVHDAVIFEAEQPHPRAILLHHHDNTWLTASVKLLKGFICNILSYLVLCIPQL